MANPRLDAAAFAALMLGLGACDRLPQGLFHRASPSSVTVKLPPARPQTPAPAFTFDAPQASRQEGASLRGA